MELFIAKVDNSSFKNRQIIYSNSVIDSNLIKQCINGNRESHRCLYEACIPYVFAVVRRYCSSVEDQKDVVQETFAKVFINLRSYDGEKGSFKSWVRKIAVNESLISLRKNRHLANLMPIIDNQGPQEDSKTEEDTLTKAELERIMIDMPQGYKVIFMMSVIDGYDHQEIAQCLDISVQTSRSQLTRAKRWLRKKLTQQSNSEKTWMTLTRK